MLFLCSFLSMQRLRRTAPVNLTWRPIGSYTPEFDFCGAERIKDKHVARQQEVSERRKRLQSASSASRWTL